MKFIRSVYGLTTEQLQKSNSLKPKTSRRHVDNFMKINSTNYPDPFSSVTFTDTSSTRTSLAKPHIKLYRH